jgi:hypothetical protein
MIDGLLVVVVLVCLDALVELVTGPQLIAAHRGEKRQRYRRQRKQSSGLFIAV